MNIGLGSGIASAMALSVTFIGESFSPFGRWRSNESIQLTHSRQ